MRRTKTVLTVVALVATLALAGCSWTEEDTLSATEGLPDTRQQLTAHTWLLDRADSDLTVETDRATTLVFGPDDLVSGSGACNTYRGTFTIDDDRVEVGPLAQTKRMCAGTANAADTEYVAALEKVRDVDATDRDRLVLTADGARLAFDAYDARDALAGTWTVTNVATADALASVSEPAPVMTVDDERISVKGCNTMSGGWTLEGDRFEVGPVASTLIGCEQAAADQDAALAAALEAASAVDVTPDRLTLLDAEGRTLIVATREGA